MIDRYKKYVVRAEAKRDRNALLVHAATAWASRPVWTPRPAARTADKTVLPSSTRDQVDLCNRASHLTHAAAYYTRRQ